MIASERRWLTCKLISCWDMAWEMGGRVENACNEEFRRSCFEGMDFGLFGMRGRMVVEVVSLERRKKHTRNDHYADELPTSSAPTKPFFAVPYHLLMYTKPYGQQERNFSQHRCRPTPSHRQPVLGVLTQAVMVLESKYLPSFV